MSNDTKLIQKGWETAVQNTMDSLIDIPEDVFLESLIRLQVIDNKGKLTDFWVNMLKSR